MPKICYDWFAYVKNKTEKNAEKSTVYTMF